MEASELYDICQTLAKTTPGAQATRQLHEVLTLVCAEGCRHQGGAFGNLFAQADFLSKRLGLSNEEAISLQTARRHTNSAATPIAAEEWGHDVKAVVRLIEAVFTTAVPGPLRALLPPGPRPRRKGLSIDMAYVRCIVSDAAAMPVRAHTADGTIGIDISNTSDGRDFGYLAKVLRTGMQLNLLDCHVLEQQDTAARQDELTMTLVPGQVIVEPDFLIDISSLAACFTPYGHHALHYTLNRLQEKPNSQATLLGNFAGTALDDIIRHGQRATTAAALQRSFREQALRLLACPDFDATKFKQQAEEQMRNIRQAAEVLKADAAGTDFRTPGHNDSYLLEPSFVCERLGLQGRVDLMTTDMRLLVEQKSGKNMKIEHQSHDRHGLQLESHYVQLLLYYGVLRYNFGRDDRHVDMRLLYSRYPAHQGLLSVNYYRTLLREALKLRNQIVATELLMAREGFGRILPLLNNDVIYNGIARDGFFHRYVQPRLDTFNQRLMQLSPLERAYFERMLTFVYREQVAAKLGSAESRLHHAGGCTADLWLMSADEKAETGNIIIAQLKEAPRTQPTGEQTVRLSIVDDPMADDRQAPRAPLNFRQGDMVSLYSYDQQPDVRHSILYKGTLQELTPQTLTIALNDAQHNADIFTPDASRRWAVEHGGSDVGTSSAIRAMQLFAAAEPQRRQLLLGQRAPQADTTRRLSRSYHADYDDVLLRIMQARDYFLLVGPPGTGKTSMALRFIVQEQLAVSAEATLLLCAYTNRAVDEICAMLCDAFPTTDDAGTPPFLRLGKAASCDERFRPYLLDTALARMGHIDQARRLVDDTRIIVATTAMLQAQPWVMQLKHFTLAVVDEASQILEPNIIGLLSSDAVERFVLIGDHKQLPAVVQQEQAESTVSEPLLRNIGLEDCRQSLFQRLLRWEQRQGRTQFMGTLHTHGRMHPLVASFPLQHFYGSEHLQPVPLPHQREQQLGYTLPPRDHTDLLLSQRRLLFLSPDATTKGDSAAAEEAEARLVADLLQRIYRFTADGFSALKTVGVIVPYRRQIALIRQFIGNDSPLMNVTIDTVERYQGSQRDVIIYSFGITHRYQLDFLTATTFTDEDGTCVDRKLNVALTRARRQMIVVGQPHLLRGVALYDELMRAGGAQA